MSELDAKKEIVEQLKFIKNFGAETEGLNDFQKRLTLEGAVIRLQRELVLFGVLSEEDII